ncbi:MAG: transporter substrate-binding domain-containing protein [Gammaproteobacteria bacterium]
MMQRNSIKGPLLTVMLMLGFLSACGDGGADGESGGDKAAASVNVAEPIMLSASAPEITKPPARKVLAKAEQKAEITGHDLDAIKARGELRILVPSNLGGGAYLPREGSPVWQQQEAAVVFAESQELTARIVPVQAFKDLIPALEAGKGDLIAANLTITDARRERIDFSVPLTHVREQLVVSADSEIEDKQDLAGRVLSVNPGTSFDDRAQALRDEVPGISVVYRDPTVLDEEEIDQVAQGEVDATIRDSNLMQLYLGYRDDVKVAVNLSGTQDIAWGLRKDAPKLKAALDHFLHTEQLTESEAKIETGDWESIKERRLLRVLLRNNAASYFLYRGELMGFEYEMAKAFAKAHKLRLEVIVPPDHRRMIDWLVEGRGDMAVGFLEPLQSRRDKGVEFTEPYHFGTREVVVHKNSTVLLPTDLADKTISVRPSSSYWEALEDLARDGFKFKIEAAPEDMETEELVARVGEGDLDVTVADSQILSIEKAQGAPVRSAFSLGKERPHAVAVRRENTELREKLDAFIKKSYKSTLYNILYKRYFTSKGSIQKLAEGRVHTLEDGSLSPWDNITKRYAEKYGFDWRLLTAQMYQESQFDPKAKSFAGAKGLMQVMPRTAKSMGFQNLEKPEQGIHAGVKYLDWVRERFESELPFSERMWFSLAAYNAGVGHVKDARRLAAELGMDPDRWFENTERAMLLLSKKKYHSKARHGYVRGGEPVSYVRLIRQRFNAYVKLTEEKLADSTPLQISALSIRH